MRFIKKYENNISKVLGMCVDLLSIKEVFNSINKFNISINVYISKSSDNLLVTFPNLDEYSDFIINGWGMQNCTWYSIDYINKTYKLIATDMEDFNLYLTANKYNL
jgi:hypothetical protein